MNIIQNKRLLGLIAALLALTTGQNAHAASEGGPNPAMPEMSGLFGKHDAYFKDLQDYARKNPIEGATAETSLSSGKGGKIEDGQVYYKSNGLVVHVVKFDANGKVVSSQQTPAGRSLETMKKFGFGFDAGQVSAQTLSKGGAVLERVSITDANGQWRGYMRFNQDGNLTSGVVYEKDGNTVARWDPPKQAPSSPRTRAPAPAKPGQEKSKTAGVATAPATSSSNAAQLEKDTIRPLLGGELGGDTPLSRAQQLEQNMKWGETTTPGSSAPPSTSIRVAGSSDLGGWDATVGIQSWAGSSCCRSIDSHQSNDGSSNGSGGLSTPTGITFGGVTITFNGNGIGVPTGGTTAGGTTSGGNTTGGNTGTGSGGGVTTPAPGSGGGTTTPGTGGTTAPGSAGSTGGTGNPGGSGSPTGSGAGTTPAGSATPPAVASGTLPAGTDSFYSAFDYRPGGIAKRFVDSNDSFTKGSLTFNRGVRATPQAISKLIGPVSYWNWSPKGDSFAKADYDPYAADRGANVMDPEEAYKDNSSVLTGTIAYNLVASNPPKDLLGRTGVLNSASLSANFTTNKLNANVDLTVAGQQWTMSGANIGFGSLTSGKATFSGQAYAASSGSAYTGFTGETMTVTKIGCSTCTVWGSFNGGFVLQNYAGALLGYRIAENTGSNGVLANAITGNALFQRSTPITNAAPNPTGRYYILIDDTLINASSVTTNAAGGLTSFTMGNSSTTTSQVDFTGTAVATGTALGGAAKYGSWQSTGGVSQITQTTTTALAPNAAIATYNAIYAIASNLVPALTGVANYTLASSSAPTTSAGVAGTLNSASLAVDFGKQTFSTSLNATLSGNTYTTTGVGTLATDGQLSLYNYGPSATKNGAALNSATLQLSGALGGDTLTSAGYVYTFSEDFSGTAFNGSVTFSGPAQPLATTSFRDVLTSGHINQYGGFLSVTGMANPAASANVNAQNQLTRYISPIDPSNFAAAPTMISANSGATFAETGMDAVTGLIWGRITGTVNTQDRAGANAAGVANISGSIHYIAGAAASTQTTYPLSGTFTYTKVGGTTPTDNAGNTGVLNSATLTADFTNLKAAATVNATVAGTTLNGATTDARITNAGFLASNGKAVGNFAVTCSGACGTNNTGALQGQFTGTGAIGAAMAYGMNTAGTGGLNKTISGVAAFKR